MQIELLEKVIEDGTIYEEGEVREVPEGVARKFLALGWARDPAGKVETGPRRIMKAELAPDGVTTVVRTEEG